MGEDERTQFSIPAQIVLAVTNLPAWMQLVWVYGEAHQGSTSEELAKGLGMKPREIEDAMRRFRSLGMAMDLERPSRS